MKGETDQKENQPMKVDTDRAWEKVYTRLCDDGLIDESTIRPTRALFPEWMKWAASFLILITTGVLIFFNITRSNETKLLSINNDENNTLIQVLHDGSVVYLAEDATLSFPEQFHGNQRYVSLTGEAFFDIVPNQEQPFVIETENHTIRVLGTSFNLKTIEDETVELIVEEGSVMVNTKKRGRKPMTVSNGEFLRAINDNYHKTLATDMTILSWKTNRMHFKDETLENILSVINRNYNAALYIEHPSLRERKMTVTFYNNSLPVIIELICLSMNLEAEENPDTGILFKPKT